MLTVEINGIGCYQNSRSFSFTSGVTLLHGETGCGKSSIFKAIDWCLYGKLRGIYNSQTSKSKVTIKICGIVIIRERGRNKLTVYTGSPTPHIGEAAQEVVYKLFGTYERWLSSSYVVQGDRNVLFTLSKVDRAKTLTWCDGIKPASVIAALKDDERSRIKSYQSNQDTLNAEYIVCERTGVTVSRTNIIDAATIQPRIDSSPISRNIDTLALQMDRVKILTHTIKASGRSCSEISTRLKSYQQTIHGIFARCGLKTIEGMITKEAVHSIITNSQIDIIYNEYRGTEHEDLFTKVVNSPNIDALIYSKHDISILHRKMSRWMDYTLLIKEWEEFSLKLGVSTMKEYVLRYHKTQQYNDLLSGLKLVGVRSPIPRTNEDIDALEIWINACEKLGPKPTLHEDVIRFRRISILSSSKLKSLIDNDFSISKLDKLQFPEYKPIEYDADLYIKWNCQQNRKDIEKQFVHNYIPESDRIHGLDVHYRYQKFIQASNGSIDVKSFLESLKAKFIMLGVDLSKVSISKIGTKYMYLVSKNRITGTKPKILNINCCSDLIIKTIKILSFIKSYKDLSNQSTIDETQYNRYVSIYHIIPDLRQLHMTPDDIDKAQSAMKTVSYICNQCGYQNDSSNEPSLSSLINKYVRWKSLKKKYDSMNIMDQEIDKLKDGLTPLLISFERSKALDSMTEKYNEYCDILSNITDENGCEFVNCITESISTLESTMSYEQSVLQWSTFIKDLRAEDIPILHSNDNELNQLYTDIKIAEHAEFLESLGWSILSKFTMYKSSQHISYDMQLSESIDRLDKVCTDTPVQLSTTQTGIFKQFRQLNLSHSDVKSLYNEAVVWEDLTDKGITSNDVLSYKMLLKTISSHQIARIIDMEERYQDSISVWNKRSCDVNIERVDMKRIKPHENISVIRNDIFILRKAALLKQHILESTKGNHGMVVRMVERIKHVFPTTNKCDEYNECDEYVVKKPLVTSQVAEKVNLFISLIKNRHNSNTVTVDTYEKISILSDNVENLVQLSLQAFNESKMLEQIQNRLLEARKQLSVEGVNCVEAVSLNIDQMKQQLDDANRSNYRSDCLNRIYRLQQTVLGSYQETANHVRLRTKVEHLKDMFDMQFLDQLNIEICKVIEQLFNTDFHFVINGVKESKSTGNIRHEIGFTIRTNGRETDIKGISGGEADRISLALTIALANIWDTKFILVDESMKSLDDETRRSCIAVLRDSEKICVCISHSDIAGMYDYELKL